jgi:hypothetical protein
VRGRRLPVPTVRSAPAWLVAGVVGAVLAATFSGRIRDWGVMTDELLYVKLASSIAAHYSPLPLVHGHAVGVVNQLYPLLLAPFFGSMSVPTAFHWAHIVNAPVMASAAVPAYLLARQVAGRRASLAVALLSVAVPWMVLTGFLMTEVVAYPAFLWSLLALQRAIATPSSRRDLVALLGIALAVSARVQFVLLAFVFPVAIIVHEIGYALVTAERGSRRRTLRDAAVGSLRSHRLLAVLCGAAAAAAALVAAFASLTSSLGVYAVTARRGSLLPGWVWQSAAAHLDSVAIGCGIVPLVLGGGWMITSLGRPQTRQRHAFATLSLLTISTLAVESASFDIRFGGREIVRDRYLFYVVPLLLAGTAAILRETRSPWLWPLALATFFAATVHWLEFPAVTGVWVDSPTRVLNDLLADEAGSLGVKGFVATAGLLLGVCAILGLRLVRRSLYTPVLFVLLLAFSVFATGRVIDHTLGSNGVSGRAMAKSPGVVLDWVDRVLPPGAKVAIVPFPTTASFAPDAVLWWDTEFWNRSVTQAYVGAGDDFHYTPFPSSRLAPRWQSGDVPGTRNAPPYVVVAGSESRFGLVGDWRGTNYGLVILKAPRPYRASWMARGLQNDGWTAPGRPATIRIFSAWDANEPLDVSILLAAPSTARASYALATGSETFRGVLPAGATKEQQLDLCVPVGSHADISLEGSSKARIPAPALTFADPPLRRAGVALRAVSLKQGTQVCR